MTLPVRFITAASIYDGHDAAINVVRRLLQDCGAEVVHLGHNRSVAEIADAAIQEDCDAVAVSSYQGGHNEFFRYLVDVLREREAAHVHIFGGGGRTRALAAGSACRRQHVRRADAHRARGQPGPDHARALRSERTVPEGRVG